MRLLIIVTGLALFSACVPNRKYLYLQKNDVNKRDLPKDSVVRHYSISPFDYRIQPHDALYIRFESPTDQKFDFLSNQQNNANTTQTSNLNSELVDEKGEISYPVIGKVKVSDLTIFEIQDKLQSLANQYLESAKVRVRLVNFRFTALGEVFREGNFTTTNNRVTLPEAIGLAGGLGELADRSNIKIIRQTGQAVEVAYINILDEGFINSPYYYLHQNDILVVPALRQRPFKHYFGQNLAVFVSSLSLLLLVVNLSVNLK